MTGSVPVPDLDPVQLLEQWMQAVEGEHFEFKEARRDFDRDYLGRYCAALANEGGGRVILGVSDRRPRRVVGSNAFLDLEKVRGELLAKIPLIIDLRRIDHPDGRVLVFEVPAAPRGTPIQWDGRFWSRRGDSLVPMSAERLRSILAECDADFSAGVCPGATTEDLEAASIAAFRAGWLAKSANAALASTPAEDLLRDAELLLADGLTYAALILFGKREALGRHLGQAEVVYEYRASEASGPAQVRREYRQGFFHYFNLLWDDIARRNDVQHYQDGLFVLDIPTFDERAVREAVLNAVCHRDYRLAGCVFVRQYPRRLEVTSPGGLPAGITPANILFRQAPRNRRVAEALSRCGLVERAGQGMNLMYEHCIRQGKRTPDLPGSDPHHFSLTLHGEVADPALVRFLDKVGRERISSFTTQDFLLIDFVRRELPISEDLRPRLAFLKDLGIIESVGRGRGIRYLLGRRFLSTLGQGGAHTRKRGLDREQNKALLHTHLRKAGARGCPISELEQVLPALSRDAIQRLLDDLRREERICLVGAKRGARWVAVTEA